MTKVKIENKDLYNLMLENKNIKIDLKQNLAQREELRKQTDQLEKSFAKISNKINKKVNNILEHQKYHINIIDTENFEKELETMQRIEKIEINEKEKVVEISLSRLKETLLKTFQNIITK